MELWKLYDNGLTWKFMSNSKHIVKKKNLKKKIRLNLSSLKVPPKFKYKSDYCHDVSLEKDFR